MSAGKTREPMTLNAFMTGMLVALSARNVHAVKVDNSEFYKAMVSVFNELELRVEEEQTRIDLKFWLMIDEIHGDSPDILDALNAASLRRLASFDNPTFQTLRLKVVGVDEAQPYLDSVPGGSELFLPLADLFKRLYPAYV